MNMKKTVSPILLFALLGAATGAYALDIKALEKQKDEVVAKEKADQLRKKAIAEENAAWTAAKGKNTIEALNRYLSAWPDGVHAGQARSALGPLRQEAERLAKAAEERESKERRERERLQDEQAWRAAGQRGTLSAYQQYVSEFPQGMYAESARQAMVPLQKEAERKERLAAEKAAKERQERDRKRDEESWKAAVAADTLDAYENYRQQFPYALHGVEVDSRIGELRKVKAQLDAERAAEAERQRLATLKELDRQKRLSDINYFSTTAATANSLPGVGKGDLFQFTTWMAASPVVLAIDMLSMPTKYYQKKKIREEASLLPAKWAKPNSLLARVAENNSGSQGQP